jgi:hypothetical protein
MFKTFHKGVDIDNTIMIFFFIGLLADDQGNTVVTKEDCLKIIEIH